MADRNNPHYLARPDENWNQDISSRGEDIYGEGNPREEEDYHNPRRPTFPIPYGRRRRDPDNPPFDIPYADEPGSRQRSTGFRYQGGPPENDVYYDNLGQGRGFGNLSERGEDMGNRPVWERDRSRRAGFDTGSSPGQRQGKFRGKGPRNYQRSDERVSEDINDRLADDYLIDASDIEVTVRSCEVTLSGMVENRDAKRRAEDIAESVSGVKNVENRLRVRRNTDWTNRDKRTMGTTRSNVSETVK